jgi:hypothetical protein
MAGNTKVNESNPSVGLQHDVRRFEIAKDDGRLAGVQVIKHRAELQTNIKHLAYWKLYSSDAFQVFFQRRAFNKIHHDVPAFTVGKALLDVRNVGMLETR